MSKNNETILKGLHVMSWIIFLGLCIEAGALIFNWIYAYFNPVVSQNLYKGLDLSDMYENQYPHFTGLMSFVVMGAILKAYLFYLVIKIFLKLNWVKPFDREIANRIEKISYEAVAIAVLSFIAQKYTTHLIHKGYEVSDVANFWSDTPAFLMMAAILYIIAQVFKKGIELQNENDLTV
ncbi:DUF2975 domain-containing protein [Flavobacterium sp.]|uniref:DUF2975 domain-containing protein n=1 Tax=Flavobacterium sp. TaxID=239 RepID=UPI002FDB2B07